MAKPTVGQTGWGGVLNDHLTGMETDIAGRQVAADLEADVAAKVGTAGALDAALSASYAAVRSVSPTYGDGATDATAHIQSVIDAADTAGEGVYVPAGTYLVSAPLENAQRVTLAPGATIKATAAMTAVVRTSLTTVLYDGFMTGKGVIDGNDVADYCIQPRFFVRFEVSGLNLRNGKVGGVKLGDAGTAGRSAEANLTNLHVERRSPLTVPVGSRGIVVENSGDHSMSSIVINAYETGVYLPSGGNTMVRDVHVWTQPSQGATKTGFEDRSNNSHYVQCHADTPTEYGWRLYGYQTTLLQCGTYINPNASTATDNIVVGVKFEGANTIATLVGHFFLGGSASKRLKADIEAADGNYGLINVVPVVGQHTVTVRAFRARVIGLDSRDNVTSTSGLVVNPSAPTGGAGLSLQTNGVDRWRVVTDGAAESGGNAGTGFGIRRYSDAGTLLSEPIWISRSSGTIVIASSISMGDGTSIVAGSTNGLKVGTAATQKLGFYGATPIARPTITGSRGGNAALASLLTQLASAGLIVDSTSA